MPRTSFIRSLGLLTSVALLLFAASACGGDGGGEASPTEQASSRCMDVPPDLVNGIETGLTPSGGGTLRNAQAVKSDDFKRVWFISAEIDASGMEGDGDIATWAKSGPLAVGDGLIMSVDSLAQEFSDWGPGDTTDAHVTMDDDGAQESHDCVESG
jgi:hypothetical protein